MAESYRTSKTFPSSMLKAPLVVQRIRQTSRFSIQIKALILCHYSLLKLRPKAESPASAVAGESITTWPKIDLISSRHSRVLGLWMSKFNIHF